MSWLRYNLLAFGDAFNHFRRAPGSFLLNVLVVAIALALPFAGMTLLENVRPVTEQLAVQPEISIFMQGNATRDQALAIAPAMRQNLQNAGSDAKIEFIPREKALDALKSKTGLNDALATLGNNPLPDAYVVKLTGFQIDAVQVDRIAAKLKTLPRVDTVQIDSAWVKRLAALMHVLRLALLFLAATLGVVVVAVVFNTIRLQVMTQYDEIAVSRLLGATDAFIHRPFYYTGALLGACAGALALAAVAIGLQPMNQAVAEFARLYGSEFQLAPLPPLMVAVLLGLSALLGLLGAMLSVRRHLSRLG
ncbi:FtsX-like permease family protein [Oxalobacteraceae bacterium CAVE-383]|nr:FtsX-like permease family protein [Oxalobacteraceae bacterium CAVE-383]